MELALEVAGLGDGLARRRRRDEDGPIGIAHQYEEQTGIGPGRLQELHAILLPAAVSPFVRQDDAPGVLAHFTERDERAAGRGLAADRVRLLIGGERRTGVGGTHARAGPG